MHHTAYAGFVHRTPVGVSPYVEVCFALQDCNNAKAGQKMSQTKKWLIWPD